MACRLRMVGLFVLLAVGCQLSHGLQEVAEDTTLLLDGADGEDGVEFLQLEENTDQGAKAPLSPPPPPRIGVPLLSTHP